MNKFTFLAKDPSGSIKAHAIGKDKEGTKEHCLKLLNAWFKKKTKDELYYEAYESTDYNIAQVDNDDWQKLI